MKSHKASGITIRVRVKPNAGLSVLEESDETGLWLARLKSPPVDGKANEELIGLVARRFGSPKSAVSITGGRSARVKRLHIENGGGALNFVASATAALSENPEADPRASNGGYRSARGR